jgi:hypothetical protein
MKWKEFLKPDKKKIVLTVIFPVLTITIYISAWLFGQMFKSGVLFVILINLFMIFAFPYFSIGSELVGLISSFIYWYLLSCLIVWVYGKVKKK